MQLTEHLGRKRYCEPCKHFFYDLNKPLVSCPNCKNVHHDTAAQKTPLEEKKPISETEEDALDFSSEDSSWGVFHPDVLEDLDLM